MGAAAALCIARDREHICGLLVGYYDRRSECRVGCGSATGIIPVTYLVLPGSSHVYFTCPYGHAVRSIVVLFCRKADRLSRHSARRLRLGVALLAPVRGTELDC